MLHGHPSIRRRIKNAFQPQINKLKDEIRSLKETNFNTNLPAFMPESKSDSDHRDRIRQLERKLADLETLQKSSNDHSVNKEVFLAEKMINQRKIENIQQELDPMLQKITSVTEQLGSLEETDKKVISNFSGILDKVIYSVDNKISLLRAEITQTPNVTPNVIFGGKELAIVEEKINQLNDSISALQSNDNHYEQLHNTDNMIMEVDSKYSNMADELTNLKSQVQTIELERLSAKPNTEISEDVRPKIMNIITGQVEEVETRLMGNLNFVATEITNLVQHMEKMENRMKEHERDHSDNSDDSGSDQIFELAAEIINFDKVNMDKFSNLSVQISKVQKDLQSLIPSADEPSHNDILFDLSTKVTRALNDTFTLKQQFGKMKERSKQNRIDHIQKLNELQTAFGTQLNANNYKIDEIEKELTHQQTNVATSNTITIDEFDNIITGLEAQIKQNITDLTLMVSDQMMSSIDTKVQLTQIEEDVEGTKQVADQSKATAELLYKTMLDSFSQIDKQRDVMESLIFKKNKETVKLMHLLEASVANNFTQYRQKLHEFKDLRTISIDLSDDMDSISRHISEQMSKYEIDIDTIIKEVAALNVAIPLQKSSITEQADKIGRTSESISSIELRLQPAIRQINENKQKLVAFAPMEKTTHDMNEDLFEKLGIITKGLSEIDSEVQVINI